MKRMSWFAALTLLLGASAMIGCEETTDDPECTLVCGNGACAFEEGTETQICACNDGFKATEAKDACVAACPAEGAGACEEYDAMCSDIPTGIECKCDEGLFYREAAGKCVPFNTVLVLGTDTDGTGVTSPTMGPDVDAIGVRKGADTTWCAAEGDVAFGAGPAGNVDAAHQTKGAVVGAPDGVAADANTYHSLGLADATGNGWVSCKFADVALGIGDILVINEVTGANAADEPFEVWACYDQMDVLDSCMIVGSEAVGSPPSATTEFTFEITETFAEPIPAVAAE